MFWRKSQGEHETTVKTETVDTTEPRQRRHRSETKIFDGDLHAVIALFIKHKC